MQAGGATGMNERSDGFPTSRRRPHHGGRNDRRWQRHRWRRCGRRGSDQGRRASTQDQTSLMFTDSDTLISESDFHEDHGTTASGRNGSV